MNDSELWAQASRYIEKLRALVDMKDSNCDLRNLDVMHSSGLWMTWMTPIQEVKSLDILNNLGLWMT